MNYEVIREIENSQLKTDIPEFKVGDTVKVYAKIVEGSKERIQMFEGVVLKRQGGSSRETFTVRRVSYGVGVEKTCHYIHQELTVLKLLDMVSLEELSLTT